MHRALVGILRAVVATATTAAVPLRTIPNADDYVEHRYSRTLRYMEETPLCCDVRPLGHVLRFIWLRTFDRPVVIRLDEKSNGTWALHTKIAKGQAGFDGGALQTNTVVTLPAEKVGSLEELLGPSAALWHVPSIDGEDGSRWIVEVRNGDFYRYVDQWSPDSGPVREVGLRFIAL